MAKIVVYLREQEHAALYTLAQREYRTLKAQAALIIRQELAHRGMIETEGITQSIIPPFPLSGIKKVGG